MDRGIVLDKSKYDVFLLHKYTVLLRIDVKFGGMEKLHNSSTGSLNSWYTINLPTLLNHVGPIYAMELYTQKQKYHVLLGKL